MRAPSGRDTTAELVARGHRGTTGRPRTGQPTGRVGPVDPVDPAGRADRAAGGAARSVAGRRGGRTARAAAGLALLAVLVAACSAGSGADSGGAQMMDSGSSAGGEVAGDVVSGGEGGAATDGGAGAADLAADAAGRQVVTTGDVSLTAADPRGAADQVVALVERAGGRVDARQETAARAQDGTDASAFLTVRVPADDVSDVLDALDDLGDVQEVDLRSEDVTAAAQDLDARIRAMRLSVARMEDLLAGAGTQADVISAENTLTERQAALEQLESQRARVAEQVALSTLRVMIWSDGAPAPTPEDRTGFLGGLASGWDALVQVLGVALLVLGALLPWLAVGALVVGGGRRGTPGAAPARRAAGRVSGR